MPTVLLNPYRYGSGAVTPIDPLTLSPTAAYLANGLGLADNDPIATLTDSSGNARHLTAAGAARPTFKTNIQNGLSVARFDGTDDTCSTATTMASFISAAAQTTFAVFKYSAVDSDTAQVFNNDAVYGDIGGNFGLSLRSSTLALSAFGVAASKVAARTIAVGTWYVSEYRHESSSIFHSINGGAEATAGSAGNDTLTSTLRAGRTNGGSSFFNGDLGELIFFNTALSAGNRAGVRAWLYAKWGITGA